MNRNPNSPYFGRIYVANDTAGTTTVNASPADNGGNLHAQRRPKRRRQPRQHRTHRRRNPRSYQWSFNRANISGATASSLSRNNAQATNEGSYQLIITNAFGSATSTVAVLTVTNTLPIILTQPAGRTNGAGTSVTLSVSTLGTDPRYWQWRFNGADISGATASSYVQNNIQTNASGDYTVVITNSFGSVTSAGATLLITNRAPLINIQPANKTVSAGSNVLFSVTSAGTTPLSYQWSFNSVEIPGASTSSYTVTNAQQPNAGSYSVIITNELGSTPRRECNAESLTSRQSSRHNRKAKA